MLYQPVEVGWNEINLLVAKTKINTWTYSNQERTETNEKQKYVYIPQEYSASLSFGQIREHDGFLLVGVSTIYLVFEASQSPI